MRPEIFNWRQRAPRREGTVLIALGGADVRGLTPGVLESLRGRGLDPVAATGLVAGPSSGIGDPDRFAEALASCSLAVIGAGTTVWECLCLGTPAIAVITADNQRAIAEAGVRAELLHARFDVRADATCLDALADSVLCLATDADRRLDLGDAGQREVDGQGATRVAEVVAGLLT